MYAHKLLEYFDNIKLGYIYIQGLNYCPVIKKAIKESQKFHLGDLADIYGCFGDKTFDENSFQGGELALPYPVTWVDYFVSVPDSISNDELIVGKDKYGLPLSQRAPSKIGVLLMEADTIIKNDESREKNRSNTGGSKLKFVIFIFHFFEEIKTWAMSPVSIPVYADGSVACVTIESFETYYGEKRSLNEEMKRDDVLQMYGTDVTAVDLFLKLLHCKNISPEPIKPSYNLNKKRRKAKKHPIYSYNILKVKLPNVGGKDKSGDAADIGSKRLHLSRAHYKDFSRGKGLFGKYKGVYLWPATVRGNKKKGVVMKDYKVETDNKK